MRHSLPCLLLSLAACIKPADPSNPPVVPQRNGPTAQESRDQRAACAYRAGALPETTLPRDVALGDAIPIQHILLVMQENRSFDHYFGSLTHGGVNVPPVDAANASAEGVVTTRYHETHYCVPDPPHGWNASHLQWGNGAMDGFVRAMPRGGGVAMGYYDDTDLPYYLALARNFAISDMHFASVMGPTWPNRLYYLAASSFGAVRNEYPPPSLPDGRELPNIFNLLTDNGVDWRVYHNSIPSAALFLSVYEEQMRHFFPLSQFYVDVAAGNLPKVAWVEANYFGGTRNDEHAPGNVQLGQQFSAGVINAVLQGPAWPRTALFLTYDEHGGFYDHVSPPAACPPGDLLPNLQDGDAQPAAFDHLGIRVPLLVISPYARRGHVSHTVTDHTSVLRFIEARFGLPALTHRDANADALFDLFDFSQPDTSIPNLPEATIDPVEAEHCTLLKE